MQRRNMTSYDSRDYKPLQCRVALFISNRCCYCGSYLLKVSFYSETRLHSSRMRTARSLTVSPSMLCARGGCLLLGGVPAPEGGAGACSGGCLVQGGGAWSGGYACSWGGTCSGLCGIPACTEADPLPPCGQNSWHTLLKILPCPKLRLRAIIKNGFICDCKTNEYMQGTCFNCRWSFFFWTFKVEFLRRNFSIRVSCTWRFNQWT